MADGGSRAPLTAAVAGLLLALSLSGTSGQSSGETSHEEPQMGPLGLNFPDPSVILVDGQYVSVESSQGRAIMVRVAPSLAELADTRRTRVWFDREVRGEVWAPEIVFRDGRYEIHFTAGMEKAHRMYVISSDQPGDGYGAATQIMLPDDKWAIDGLPFTYRGVGYYVWSGWPGDENGRQDIYIARMGADGSADGPRVSISSPDRPWELVDQQYAQINEGPQPIIDPDGRLHVSYSANGSWGPSYCIADLRLKADGDPLDPDDWFKSDGCQFGAAAATLGPTATRATLAKGTGHHSFVLPDGDVAQSPGADVPGVVLYHGVEAALNPSNFWTARQVYGGTFNWAADVTYIGRGGATDTGWGMTYAE